MAVNFINDYLSFLHSENSEVEMSAWVRDRSDVTQEMKDRLDRLITEAELIDPEMGLNFDPIINGPGLSRYIYGI